MSPVAERLSRLESYLAEDPRNPVLLGDACDAAIEAGFHARALQHLEVGQQIGTDPVPWLWRRARLAIARRELDAAGRWLAEVQSLVGDQPAVVHDSAYVHFLQRDFEACRGLIAPRLGDSSVGEQRDALQSLWLRATHAAGHVQEGWDWIVAQGDALGPAVRGVASLLAVDRGDFAAAATLADHALAGHSSSEALVARGTVALAQRDVAGAGRWLAQALQENPDDGRTWAMLGLASLQVGQLADAQARLERAVVLMPGHIGTWHALAWTHLLQQHLDDARKAIEQALALDDSFSESHGMLGLMLALQGDAGLAERHLAIATRLDKNNVSGRYAQALLRGELANPDHVQATLRGLLERPGLFRGRLADEVLAAIHPGSGAP